MASAKTTRDPNEIRKWAEERGGRPAQVTGTGGLLRINFDEPGGDDDEGLEDISWDDFFQELDEGRLEFLYSPEKDNRFNKFVRIDGGD